MLAASHLHGLHKVPEEIRHPVREELVDHRLVPFAPSKTGHVQNVVHAYGWQRVFPHIRLRYEGFVEASLDFAHVEQEHSKQLTAVSGIRYGIGGERTCP
eukprot:6180786-Pleurochrysis_carterae.AAC.3